MFKCHHCCINILDLNSYIKHLKEHKNVIEYECKFGGCVRSFQQLESLRSHIKRCKFNKIPLHHCDLSENSSLLVYEPNSGPSTSVPLLEVEEYESNLSFSTQIGILIPEKSMEHKKTIDELELDVLKNILSMYNENYFARKNILKVLKLNFDLFSTHLDFLFATIEKASEFEAKEFILDSIISLKNSYSIPSEHILFKKLEKLGYLQFPRQIFIGSKQQLLNKNNSVKLKEKKISIQMVNLVQQFETFFNKTNMLEDILEHLNALNSRQDGCVYNFTQSAAWKEKLHVLGEEVDVLNLPLLTYFDDFECNNSLGSHSNKSGKIGGVYTMIPCFPDFLQAKLIQIFLGMLFLTNDRKIPNGNSRIFAPFVSMLNKLQTDGVPVNHPKYKRVKFVSSLIVGDNLGLNQILGFTEGFKANFFCRICKMGRNSCMKETYQNPTLLRNESNFVRDLQIGNARKTGIKSDSIFNEINNFHVVNNIVGDLMHDWEEGICHYDITRILRQFIYEDNLFTVEDYNTRLKSHDFGLNSKNKPPEITYDMLFKDKLKCSATEMNTLVMNLNVLIGDYITEGNQYWKLYLLLREILIHLHKKSINEELINYVEDLIAEHHQLFIDCFGYLRPKYHFGTHYAHIMLNIGPVSLISSIRFEAKHQQFKEFARSSRSRLNTLYTLALRHQLKIAHILFNYNEISIKSRQITNSNKSFDVNIKILEKYKIKSDLKSYTTYKWIEFMGIKYKKGIFIQISYNIFDLPIYYRIDHIILINDQIYFCLEQMMSTFYSIHYQTINIKPSASFSYKSFESLINKQTFNSIKINGQLCINST